MSLSSLAGFEAQQHSRERRLYFEGQSGMGGGGVGGKFTDFNIIMFQLLDCYCGWSVFS